jgi:hypothetical protein
LKEKSALISSIRQKMSFWNISTKKPEAEKRLLVYRYIPALALPRSGYMGHPENFGDSQLFSSPGKYSIGAILTNSELPGKLNKEDYIYKLDWRPRGDLNPRSPP